MKLEIITLICLITIIIFLVFALIAIIVYDRYVKHQTLNNLSTASGQGRDWLFSGFQESLFDICFKNPKSDTICGIPQKDYERYCKILHIRQNLKILVAMRVEAAFLLFILLVLAFILSYNVFASIVCMLIGMAAMFFLWVKPYSDIKKEADERLFRIQDDLPRFLSLLEKAMDLPVDQAIIITASRFPSPLSEDILDSINKVSLGANGWTETLIDLAKTYNIEDFSDLILEIVNAYEQGVNIRNLIIRKIRDVEETHLYAVESHDSKIKTLIFLPIILLKVLPLMVMICLPMMGNFL